jgi:hypothetical protein
MSLFSIMQTVASNGLFNCPIQFSIDSHNLTVIASDGAPFEPIEVESVNVFPGQRFDIIVHTDQSIGNYWMRIRGEADCSVKKAKQVAIVRAWYNKKHVSWGQTFLLREIEIWYRHYYR